MDDKIILPLLSAVIIRVALKQVLLEDERLIYLLHMKKFREAKFLNNKLKKFPI